MSDVTVYGIYAAIAGLFWVALTWRSSMRYELWPMGIAALWPVAVIVMALGFHSEDSLPRRRRNAAISAGLGAGAFIASAFVSVVNIEWPMAVGGAALVSLSVMRLLVLSNV